MAPKKLIATLGTVLLFGVGVATAAFADTPPATSEPTTTEPTAPTSTTTTDATSDSTTSTVTTTAPAETTQTTPTTPTVPTTNASAPQRHATIPRGLPHGASVADTPPGNARPAAVPHRKRHRRRVSRPLTVTPPLGRGSYVFPVVGAWGYVDTYGGFRGDVHGNWHHGVDLFAPLGTPVVAVADGTINRVGWEKVGGWRLWVRDAAADEFYYAHLSGYAPGIFHSRHVRAGQVIGFVGNTGDAFPGGTHLHFEIHPHQLLRLRYDGAVDPATYLVSWSRLSSVDAPVPVHPRLPAQPLLRQEARDVFRKLLVARHVIDEPLTAFGPSEVDRPPAPSAEPAPHTLSMHARPLVGAAASGSSRPIVPLFAGLLTLVLLVATPALALMALVRPWRKRAAESG